MLLREGLAGLLGRFGMDAVGLAGDAAELVAAVERQAPDLVITDVRMPPGFSDEGLRAAIALRQADPSLPVVVLTQYVERAGARELLESEGSGGLAYPLKDRVADVTEFVATVCQVAGGATVIDPQVVRQLLRSEDPTSRLTPREREVLSLVAEGHSNAAIAARLVVTEAAVDTHIGNIFGKLGLPPNEDQNRRVVAVLTYLGAGG